MKIAAMFFTALILASMFAGTAIADDGVDHSKPGPDLSTERPDSTASSPAWFAPDHCFEDRQLPTEGEEGGLYICGPLTVYRAEANTPPANPGLTASDEEKRATWAAYLASVVPHPQVATTYR